MSSSSFLPSISFILQPRSRALLLSCKKHIKVKKFIKKYLKKYLKQLENASLSVSFTR